MFENEYLSCKSIDEIRKILSDLMMSRSPLSKNLFVTEKSEDSYIVRSASWSRYTFRPSAISHTLKLYKAGNVVRIKTKWKPTVRSFSIMFLIILAWLLIICTSGIASTTKINFFEMLTAYGQGLFLAVGLGVLATAVFVFIEKIKLSRFINNHLLKADYSSQQLKTEQNSIEQVDRALYILNNESIKAFVHEEVPKEDMDLFNSWKLKDTQGNLMIARERGLNEEYYYPKHWFADRERGIYYILLGGEDRGQIDVYALIWKGEKIIIKLRERVNFETNIQEEVLHYDIFQIIVSPNLESTTTADEIRDILIETVKADAFRYWPQNTKFVFDNIATPIFVDAVE